MTSAGVWVNMLASNYTYVLLSHTWTGSGDSSGLAVAGLLWSGNDCVPELEQNVFDASKVAGMISVGVTI